MQIILPGINGNGEIYLDIMKAICGDTSNKSMVDLMCHHAPYTSQLGFKHRVYVDVLDRGLDNPEEQKWFIKNDVFIFLYENSHCHSDVMICSDGIEHLSKQAGFDLALTMELQSDKAIIFTPLGEWMITQDSSPDSHKSGWLPEDFKGYASIVLPDFHPILQSGAFFVWKCVNIEQDFERVKNELNNKTWIKSF